jgi:hypothetical protein
MSRVIEREREPFPPRWMFFVLALMIIAGLVWNVYVTLSATAEKNTAQANSQTLAQDIQQICKAQGRLMVDDRDLCAKAEKVQEQPTQALPGPKGDKGNAGERGLQGFPGLSGAKGDPGPLGPVGPKGDRGNEGLGLLGLPGLNGTSGQDGPAGPPGSQGPAGEPGRDGADSTVPGPEGPAGPAGQDGAPGQPGTDGRSITDAQCRDDGRWAISWSDGTTTDGGACRAAPIAPGVTP